MKCSPFAAGRDDVPRSITSFLQTDIQRLQSSLSVTLNQPYSLGFGSQVLEQDVKDHTYPSPPTPVSALHADSFPIPTRLSTQDQTRRHIRGSASSLRIISATFPLHSSIPDITRMRLALTPSQVSQLGNRHGELSSSSVMAIKQHVGLNIKNIKSIPPSIVQTLVNAYIRTMHILQVFVEVNALLEQVDHVLKVLHTDLRSEVQPDYDFLIVHLVLAISVSLGSATSGHGHRRMLFSEALFREGIQHLSTRSIFKSEIAELQATLLILQYGTINPRCASVWLLGGAAMRHCLRLGLHRDLPESEGLDALQTDMRRRLFWMAYCLDKHICVALQCPISIPDRTILASDFSIYDDSGITPAGIIANTPASKAPAVHWLEYRRLHSDMVEVHFHAKPLRPGQTWDSWVADMEISLSDWYLKHNLDYAWTETAYKNARTYLHRPSPRTPIPSPHSLLIAFENACAVAFSYLHDISAGYFRRPWLAAHHTFGSAIIVLFCLRHGSGTISMKFDSNTICELTRLFTTNLRSISSQTWPEVAQCAEIYEQLLKPLIESLIAGEVVESALSPEQDAQLARLLYPGTVPLDIIGANPGLVPVLDDIFPDFGVLDWSLMGFEGDRMEGG